MEEEKKERIKNWLKNPYNFLLVIIIILAVLVRLYYFFLTTNQPLWWDEAEYMSAAKSYAGIVDYKLGTQRLPGFPLFVSLFYRIGISNEPALRFILLLIPSLLVILLTYLCIKEMYSDKKVALISTAIMIFLWEHLFYSNRFHTENLALIFEFLAILILFKSYMKNQNFSFIKPKYSLIFIALFSLISVLFRPGNLVFFPTIFLFIILLQQSRIFSRKGLKITIPVILLFLLFVFLFYSKITALGIVKSYYHPENQLAWNSLSVFKGYYEPINASPNILYYSFLLGLILIIINFFSNLSRLKTIQNNSEELEYKSDMFNFFTILVVMFFFVFVIRSYQMFEFRWFFPLLLGMFAFTAKGAIFFSEFIADFMGDKKKIISLILLLLISLAGIYTQFVHADSIIRIKLDSYSEVRDSGLWLKENTLPQDVIISASITQHTYYSERKTEDFYVNSIHNETLFNEKVTGLKPKFLVVSAFEPVFTPQWAYSYPERHNNTLIPIQVYLDKDKKQPLLVIYKFLTK